MRIYVTGASGFIGRRCVRAVAAHGHVAVALSLDATWIARAERVEVRELDLLVPGTILPAIRDCDAGIHAAGAGPGATPAQLHDLNVVASRNLAAACRDGGAPRRLVAISSAAVFEPGETEYRAAKRAQEEVLAAAGLELTLLRPTLVLGSCAESAELSRLVARLAPPWPRLLPAGGRNRIQPVHVDDVAQAALAAVGRASAIGRNLVIAGPEEGIPISRLWREARDRTGGRARIVPLPLSLLRAAACLLRPAGAGAALDARIAFFSHDHLHSLAEAAEILGYRPRPYDEMLAGAFGS